jgi:hypothetical protein
MELLKLAEEFPDVARLPSRTRRLPAVLVTGMTGALKLAPLICHECASRNSLFNLRNVEGLCPASAHRYAY